MKTVVVMTCPKSGFSAEQIDEFKKDFEKAGMVLIVIQYHPAVIAPTVPQFTIIKP